MKEKRILPLECFSMVDPILFGVDYEQGIEGALFVVGRKYVLQHPFSEMGRDRKKVYELRGMVDTFHDVTIDALIMKQISGERGTIFSLSKRDCESLGVDYDEGLQLFPKAMHWEMYQETAKAFNPNDMSTTPCSRIDGTIRYVMLQLEGFHDDAHGYIKTPNGKLVREHEFTKRLHVSSNQQLFYGVDDAMIDFNQPLRGRVEKPKGCGLFYPYGNFIANNGNIYISISFVIPCQGYTTDGRIGIPPTFLNNVNPREFFNITFDESGLNSAVDVALNQLNRQIALSAATLLDAHETSIWNDLQVKIITL